MAQHDPNQKLHSKAQLPPSGRRKGAKSKPSPTSTRNVDESDWIDFENTQLFSKEQQQLQQQQQVEDEDDDDDDSSIPVGSDVDVGPNLTDEEEFSADLDSECVDDTGALEKMKQLLGHEVSLQKFERLARAFNEQQQQDEDDRSLQAGSIQSELIQRRCSFNSSRSSNLDATHYTAPVDGKKPTSRKLTKSKKEKKEKKEKKKKKKAKKEKKEREEEEEQSSVEYFATYMALGDDDDSIIEEAQQEDGSIHAAVVAHLKHPQPPNQDSLVNALQAGIPVHGK